ncbi:MAG: hypothetical protein KAY44_04670 [Neisseria sp.]|nr:hypothetical protein [Neisseria sp.]
MAELELLNPTFQHASALPQQYFRQRNKAATKRGNRCIIAAFIYSVSDVRLCEERMKQGGTDGRQKWQASNALR